MQDYKVALVTGSSSGIGRDIAIAFAKQGYRVVVTGRNIPTTTNVYKEIRDMTEAEHSWVQADLTLRKDAERLVESTIRDHGRIDVLVNNAGLFTPAHIGSGIEAYETYKNMMETNLDTAVLMTLLTIPYLKKTKGCIVNISSNLHKVCLKGSFAYSAAKAGLTMFTKSCAVELAPDIRVNSVSPGPVATQMSVKNGMPIGVFRKCVASSCLVNRVGEPKEIARMVLFLSSPESAFITGSDFIIDGGSTIKPAGVLMGCDK